MIRDRQSVSVTDLLAVTGRDSILVVIVALSILNVILAPLPFNSLILGIPLVLLSLAHALNLDIHTLSWRWLHRQHPCTAAQPYLEKAAQWAAGLERWTRPRWGQLLIFESRAFSGACLLLLSVIILLPIPFANIPGSIGMLCVAAGLMQRDGMAVTAGYGIALTHILVVLGARELLL